MKQNEIDFMKFMEESVLPNRHNISYDTLVKAGSFVGIPINTGCRSCAQKGGVDLLNRYGQMKQAWIEWKKEQELLKQVKEEVYTQFTQEILKADEETIVTPEMGHIKDVEVTVPEIEITEYHSIIEPPKTFPKKGKGRK